PAGPRNATRIVMDSRAELPATSQLATSANDQPVIVVTRPGADPNNVKRLQACGCEILICDGESPANQVEQLLRVLGQRKMTQVLVEGGGVLLGQFFDAKQVDEVHVFMAPKIVGGADASNPVGGKGVELMAGALHLENPIVESLEGDVYLRGRLRTNESD
ncbi:MAG: RibD family protein, partial [Planctomycetes bacterium]|nr:RibD family protein [Planctomycetota bacterium]